MGFLVVVLGLPESSLSVEVWPVSNESGVLLLGVAVPPSLIEGFSSSHTAGP